MSWAREALYTYTPSSKHLDPDQVYSARLLLTRLLLVVLLLTRFIPVRLILARLNHICPGICSIIITDV
jgi:hypothetical protein